MRRNFKMSNSSATVTLTIHEFDKMRNQIEDLKEAIKSKSRIIVDSQYDDVYTVMTGAEFDETLINRINQLNIYNKELIAENKCLKAKPDIKKGFWQK